MRKKNTLEQTYKMSIDEKIDMVKKSIRAVTRGYKNSRLITGTPGIGKTTAVIEELLTENIPYKYFAGGVKNAKSLYTTLYNNNYEDCILIFDDCNDVLKNKQAVEILRVAVDDKKNRVITYSDHQLKKENKIPTEFKFVSKMIIITNIQKKKIDDAIVSRTNAIEILASKDEIMRYIHAHLKNIKPKNMNLEMKKEVYDYLVSEITVTNIKQIDFRVFEDLLMWRLSVEGDNEVIIDKTKEWKKLIYNVIC